jgi:hypothetical protein
MNDAWDPELAALLDTERERRGPGALTRSRVLERVQRSVAMHPVSGRAPRMGPAPAFARTMLRPALAAALLLGAGVAAARAMRRDPAPVHVDATTAPPPTASETVVHVPPVVSATPPPPVLAAPEPVVVRATPAPTKVEPPVSTLPAERALLDRARKDLLSGEAPAALEEVETHARLFRHGLLSEERDALRVEALVAAQRYEPARAAGARFHVAYPGSMLAPAVDDALGTIP